MIRHLPNLLSALRLLAAPLAAWAILHDRDTAAFLVFLFAGVSDAADGYIARHWGFTSRFGAHLDPAADKLLMLLCFLALWQVGVAPPWLVLLVIARDVLIAAGWLAARLMTLAMPDAPLLIGKASTVAQIVYVGLLLALLALDHQSLELELAAAAIVALLAVLSGLAYALRFVRAAA